MYRFYYNNTKKSLGNQGSHSQKPIVRDSLLYNLHNALYSRDSIVEHSGLLFNIWAIICRKDTEIGLIHVFIPISSFDYL